MKRRIRASWVALVVVLVVLVVLMALVVVKASFAGIWVWSMEYGIWSMQYAAWSMEYGVWRDGSRPLELTRSRWGPQAVKTGRAKALIRMQPWQRRTAILDRKGLTVSVRVWSSIAWQRLSCIGCEVPHPGLPLSLVLLPTARTRLQGNLDILIPMSWISLDD